MSGRRGQIFPAGAYLGCSWTWCIGMFLPVLLVRDFGLASFLIFVLPNVLGAAAMGFVLRRAGESEEIIRTHRGACRLFSFITITFQLYFLLWISSPQGPLGPALGTGIALTTACVMIVLVAMTLRRERLGLVSISVWLFSLLLAVVFVASPAMPQSLEVLGAHSPLQSPDGLIPLSAVCVLGFLLCPYLDLTFHSARQMLPGRAGTAAFALGFGVFFLTMILFTLAYAGILSPLGGSPHPLTAWVAAHMVVQLAFTVFVHAREIRRGLAAGASSLRWLAAAGVLAVTTWMAASHLSPYAGLSSAEIGYRLFMAFYGLIFPAYVWICMLPLPAGLATPRRVGVWLGACALASPMYWMGFIERQSWWLLPGVGVVVLARLLAPSSQASTSRAVPRTSSPSA